MEAIIYILSKNILEKPFPRINEAAALRAKIGDNQRKILKGGCNGTHQIPCADSGAHLREVILVSKSIAPPPRSGAQLAELPMD